MIYQFKAPREALDLRQFQIIWFWMHGV